MNRQVQPRHYREIFNIALPVGLEAIFQASFSLIDQIIVGSLGASAVAAVGLSNNLSFILTLLYSAVGTGSGAFIAQAYGRRDMEEVSKIGALGQSAAVTLGICSSLPLVLFPNPILRFLGAQEELAKTASVYLQLFAASAPLTVMSAVTTATFRSMSDSRTPMMITMGAVCLNTVVALLLVLGIGGFPKLGVPGAALATLISQAVRAVVLVTVLLPVLYPRVDKQVLNLAFWGTIIVATAQPAKVLNNVLGIGILPSGGDTKFVLFRHIVTSYAVGLPIAALTALILRWGAFSTFTSRALEEVLKAVVLFARYRTGAWQRELKT